MDESNTSLTLTEDHQMSHPGQLNDRQQIAISMLLAGRTHRDVGLALGVARETVTRWSSRNPFFQAELNRCRKDSWDASRDRLRNLSSRALDVLEWALMNGDTKVALEFLKRMDNETAPGGSTTPSDVIDDMARSSAMQLCISKLDTAEERGFRKLLREHWMPEENLSLEADEENRQYKS